MDDRKVFVHIGPHKTASTMLQKIFSKLRSEEIAYFYRPDKFMQLVNGTSDFKPNSLSYLLGVTEDELPAKVLISEEDIFGDVWRNYDDFYERVDRIVDLVPDAIFIIVLRNQADWLASLYRHYFNFGGYMSAAKFLGYSRGEFVYKKTNDKYNINALGYDWSNHINYLQNLVGEEKVKVLFQEELALSEEKFYARIGCVLGVKINAVKKRERVNRGVSALGLNCARIVRIFFNSVDRFIGIFVESGSVIGKFNWKLSKAIVRKVFRNGVDRLLFIDWDLVGKKRRIILMKYYQNMNKGLLPYFPDEDIKNKYF